MSFLKDLSFEENKKCDAETILLALLIPSAILGYVVSHGKIYLFHALAGAYLLATLLGAIKISHSSIKSLWPFFMFYVYAILTLTWTPSIMNGLYHTFYLTNGLFLVFLIVNYARTLSKLNFVFLLAQVTLLLNFLFGFLESTGYFRIPISPLFGSYDTRPSGFNFNPNNFGFVFMITFPFLFFYPKKIIRFISIAISIWFALRVESKGLFLTMILFFLFYFLIEIKKNTTWYRALTLGALLGLVSLALILTDSFPQNRILSTFDHLKRGIHLIGSGNVDFMDSTGLRSSMYSFGISQLIDSHGLGLGLSGISTLLTTNPLFNFGTLRTASFHNFFLELLIDLGLIPFIIIMLTYLYTIFSLLRISKNTPNPQLQYASQASAFSLFIALPASVAPSSIIYELTFWILLGYSVAILNIYKWGKRLNEQ